MGKRPYDPDLIYYSASSLKDQGQCPARNYFKKYFREHNIKFDLNFGAIYGSAAHQAIEERLKFERNPYTVAGQYIQENLLDVYSPSEIDQKEFGERQTALYRVIKNFEDRYYLDLMNTLRDPQSQIELGLEVPWRKGILVGKIDVALDNQMADWKTSLKMPSYKDIWREIQHSMYFYLAYKTGLPLPEQFTYIYLYGFNIAKKETEFKSGPRKGEAKFVEDTETPQWVFDFPAYTKAYATEESRIQHTNSVLVNKIIPLARSYEQGIVYKQQSNFNCSSCKYRKVCDETDLPKVSVDEHNDLIQPRKSDVQAVQEVDTSGDSGRTISLLDGSLDEVLGKG